MFAAASQQPLLSAASVVIVLIILVALTFFGFLLLIVRQYKRCPPNQLLVVYGRTPDGQPKIIHGGSAFVLPLIQDYAYLNLDPIKVTIPPPTGEVPKNLRSAWPRNCAVAIGTAPPLAQNAAVRLLGLSRDQIEKCAEEAISGALARATASVSKDDATVDQQAFFANVQSTIKSELQSLGLQLLSLPRLA